MAKRKPLADAFKSTPPAQRAESVQEEKEAPQDIPKTNYKAPSRKGKKFVGGYFDSEVAKQLKILAVEEETTNQKLIKEADNDLFQKHGKSRIA